MDAFLDTQLYSFLLEMFDLIPVVAGVSVFISVLIDQLKRLKVLPDGYAPLVSGGLNLVFYIVLYFLSDAQDAQVVGIFGDIATVMPYLVSLFLALGVGDWTHNYFKQKGIGYSYTLQPR